MLNKASDTMKSQKNKHFQIAILGGGITGSSIFHILSKYTNADSICLIEKYPELGQVNSHGANNSQTLHFGDIETNYSTEKAATTKSASEMVVRALERLGQKNPYISSRSHKLALAVGQAEVNKLRTRFTEFKNIFPELQLIERERIAELEPEIVNERNPDEPLLAFYSDKSYVIDFGRLAKALVSDVQTSADKTADVFTDTKVLKIKKHANHYEIITNKGSYTADAIIVAMCAHSLMFAKPLGYGLEYSILPVGGNFYTSNRKVLNGKVYTMQSGKLPFAAVHGDPNLGAETQTRFGPTANVMPFLERNNIKTFFDFRKSSLDSPRSIIALFKVIFEPTLFSFLLKSLAYELPYFGPRAFAKVCQKIIPSLKYADFKNGKTKAGIRPQLINNTTGKLMMGEIEIAGDKILFNITPSPGATACLQNAVKSVNKTLSFFDGQLTFDQTKFDQDYCN